MNTLELTVIQSPAELEEECAKFVIDDTLSPFVLHNITTTGEQYTLSLWIRSDAEGSIIVRGTTLPTTPEWSRYTVTYTANDANLKIFFNTADTYNIYHPKLEAGGKATDYTTAPEDIEDRIDGVSDELHEAIVQLNTDIIQKCESIVLQAVENYVKTGDFEEFKSTVSTQFQVMAEGIEMNFTHITEQITTVDGEVQTKFTELYNYIRVNAEDGSMTFGSSENAITLSLEHDMIIFRRNGEQFGWWDGEDFHTGNIVVEVNERAQFGNFAFIPRSDGSLSFLKVGG